MNPDWQFVKDVMPPTDGTQFQVAWYGDWCPVCKADEKGIYEWTDDEYGQSCWSLLAEFREGSVIGSVTNMYWAPAPVLPTKKYDE